MIKVCFISHHFRNPTVFLDTLRKMTPNRSGVWKDMVAVTKPNEADFCAIFDAPNVPVPDNRSIYFGQHPPCMTSFTRWENKQALLKLSLDKYLNPGEWWISHDYDALSKMQPPTKSKKAICAFTAATHCDMYLKRVKFMQEVCPKVTEIDLFGRPKQNFINNPILSKYYKGVLGKSNPNGVLGEHMVGKESFVDYKYSIEFDVGPTANYFSERFYDALLLWVIPLYWGGTNVHEFIPKEAFHYININDFKEVDKIKDIINSDYWETHIEDIAKARDLLLNKYQTWAYVYDVVTNIDKYLKK